MKYYVTSGALLRIVLADTPVKAAEKALELCHGETIDARYFYVDERGFREVAASHKIPVNNVLRTQGFVDEPDSDESDGGTVV